VRRAQSAGQAVRSQGRATSGDAVSTAGCRLAAGRAAVQDLRRLTFEREPLFWVEIEVELARG
jgi:hypothetical protein